MADNSDVLMMLCQQAGSPIQAECQAKLGSKDDLLTMSPGFVVGKFFELESFSLNIAAEPSDATGTDSTKPVKIGRGTTWSAGMLNPVTCVRAVDNASPLLFEQCGKAGKFVSATIVRRKVIGGGLTQQGSRLVSTTQQDQDSFLMAYMRIDFDDVVIMDLNWESNDEMIKETIKFVCSSATVQYRQQLAAGSVTARKFPSGVWTK